MERIPAVSVMGADGPIELAAVGAPLVVYFYPRDDTSGCTREAIDFSSLSKDFAAAGVRVIGVSKDSPASHARFALKHGITIELASDDGTACEAFGVWGPKKLYGKTYLGIERTTFLFKTDGSLAQVWRKVRVPGHAEAVLEAARAL